MKNQGNCSAPLHGSFPPLGEGWDGGFRSVHSDRSPSRYFLGQPRIEQRLPHNLRQPPSPPSPSGGRSYADSGAVVT